MYYFAAKFLMTANVELEKHVFGFSEEAIDLLSGCAWNGNIRELKNMIKKATLLANDVIELEHLLVDARNQQPTLSLDGLLENALMKGLTLSAINEVIRKAADVKVIEHALHQSQGNKSKACRDLGIDYTTLFRKEKRHRLNLAKR